MRRSLAGVLLAGSISACQVLCVHDCYAPPEGSGLRTIVTVIPAADGHIGTVVVDPDGDRTVLDTAYASATVATGRPAVTYAAEAPQVTRQFEALLQARPPPPVTLTAWFVAGTDTLSAESSGLLGELQAEVARRENSEITVTGHTDRVGTEARNDDLGERRAILVRDQLIRLGIPPGMITVVSRGERDPLVPTADGIPEPRNRRVEINIR